MGWMAECDSRESREGLVKGFLWKRIWKYAFSGKHEVLPLKLTIEIIVIYMRQNPLNPIA